MKLETYLKTHDLVLFESIDSLDDVPDKNKGGDCYQKALHYMMSKPTDNQLILCHGLVTGQGAIRGIVYGHAWVEKGNKVIDETIPLEIDKGVYYAIGNIKKNNVWNYDRQQMSEKVQQFKTYGPWEKKILNNKY